METARALAAAGAHVVLAARNAERTEAAARSIRERVPGAVLEVGSLDLTSLDNVRAFATWYLDRHDELQLLINNAGVMYTPFEHTADGFEMQFGTNHIGHFLLTCLLVPALLAGAPSRVVNLSSGGHMGSDIVWDDPNFERRDYDKFAAYGQSKTANILFSVELDRRLADRGVHSYAVHPGMIATELGRYMTARRHGRVAGARQARARVVGCRRARAWNRAPPPRCGPRRIRISPARAVRISPIAR